MTRRLHLFHGRLSFVSEYNAEVVFLSDNLRPRNRLSYPAYRTDRIVPENLPASSETSVPCNRLLLAPHIAVGVADTKIRLSRGKIHQHSRRYEPQKPVVVKLIKAVEHLYFYSSTCSSSARTHRHTYLTIPIINHTFVI